jgi:hypothetical protein
MPLTGAVAKAARSAIDPDSEGSTRDDAGGAATVLLAVIVAGNESRSIRCRERPPLGGTLAWHFAQNKMVP